MHQAVICTSAECASGLQIGKPVSAEYELGGQIRAAECESWLHIDNGVSAEYVLGSLIGSRKERR